MRIPEAHICDVAGCTKDAEYRIAHRILSPTHPMMPGHRDMVFEFCVEHASDFSITGRGAWDSPPRLKPGVPEEI